MPATRERSRRCQTCGARLSHDARKQAGSPGANRSSNAPVEGSAFAGFAAFADFAPGRRNAGDATFDDATFDDPPAGDSAAWAALPLAGLTLPALRKTSPAVWIAAGVVGVAAAFGTRTGRRAMATGWTGAKAAGAAAWSSANGAPNEGPAIVRAAFEDLGPTYIKLGQLIASSEGLFPERYCLEFRKCLDRVRPFSFEQVMATLEEELGRDPAEVFSWIDPEPLASASIAQVHAARTRDGQEVVIKVQRPKIRELVEADLRVLRLAARAVALSPRGELANPVGVVEDFAANIHEELDFRLEVANMAEFNRIMLEHGQTQVAAPRVLDGLSTPRVIVMERFFGHRVDDVAKLRAANVDGEERLLLGMRAWFQCMILHGFFHGDVHAGNLMALSDGRIGFLDFGIVGRFTRERREQVTDYLMAFVSGDFHKLAEIMVAMGAGEGAHVDVDALAKDLVEAYGPMFADDLSAMKYADILPTIIRTGVKHGTHLPREFVLVVKQMLYFDRYAKVLAPKLNVFRDPRIVAALVEDVMAARAQVA